jgi:hypothetical protein
MGVCARRWAGWALTVWVAGGGMVAGCGTVPMPQATFQTEQAISSAGGSAHRLQNCARLGGVGLARRLATRIVHQAARSYDLETLVSPGDLSAARVRLARLVVWRLGSPQRVCDLYVRRGAEPFVRRFADDAAAILLGLVDVDGERPTYRLPRHLVGFLGREGPVTPRRLRDLGLPQDSPIRRTRDGYVGTLEADDPVPRRLIDLAVRERRVAGSGRPLPERR